MQGEIILESLVDLSGKLSVRIAVNTPQESQPLNDLKLLNQSGDTFMERECSMLLCLTSKCTCSKENPKQKLAVDVITSASLEKKAGAEVCASHTAWHSVRNTLLC